MPFGEAGIITARKQNWRRACRPARGHQGSGRETSELGLDRARAYLGLILGARGGYAALWNSRGSGAFERKGRTPMRDGYSEHRGKCSICFPGRSRPVIIQTASRVGLTPSPTCQTRQGGFSKGRCGQGRQPRGPTADHASALLGDKPMEGFKCQKQTERSTCSPRRSSVF